MNYKNIIDNYFKIYIPSACVRAVFEHVSDDYKQNKMTQETVLDMFSNHVLGKRKEDVTRSDLVEAITNRSWERPSYPMYGNPDGSTTGYMCLTDFEYELGNASGSCGVYSSVEDLKASRHCVEGCGIVEVRIYATKIIQETTDHD